MALMQTSYSYLDVVGRTTVVIKKKNVVGEHNVPFQVGILESGEPCFFFYLGFVDPVSYHSVNCMQVYYEFSPIFMLAEPLMLVTAVLLLFAACIVYLHTDLSIAKSQAS